MEIGLIGVGAMGEAMGANLLRAGFGLRVWNRTASRCDALVALGALRVASPAEALSGPDGIVVSMVADDAALRAVVDGPQGLAEALGAGGLHVSMSTIAPDTARAIQATHIARGTAYVAAPVFGRPDAAAAKKLFVLSAGAIAARERARPILEAMGQAVIDLGDDPVHANVVKLGGNFMIMGMIEALAETLGLAEGHGVPRQTMVDVLTQTILPAPLVANYGRQIAGHAYSPARFRLALGLKDADLVLGAAREANVPMPLAQLMQGRLLSAVARGRGEWDWTGAALGVAEDAGRAPAKN